MTDRRIRCGLAWRGRGHSIANLVFVKLNKTHPNDSPPNRPINHPRPPSPALPPVRTVQPGPIRQRTRRNDGKAEKWQPAQRCGRRLLAPVLTPPPPPSPSASRRRPQRLCLAARQFRHKLGRHGLGAEPRGAGKQATPRTPANVPPTPRYGVRTALFGRTESPPPIRARPAPMPYHVAPLALDDPLNTGRRGTHAGGRSAARTSSVTAAPTWAAKDARSVAPARAEDQARTLESPCSPST